MIQTERRKTPRASIHKLAYVNFEPYNTGGVITEISRAGLRFHTVVPVRQGGLVRLSIVLGAANQLEAVGELVWTDATRTIGGVRFVVLPPAAADQIQNWAEANSGNTEARSAKILEIEANASIPNQASAHPEKPAAFGEDGVAEKGPVSQSQNTPAATVEQNARPPWAPPSARPPAMEAPPIAQPPNRPNASTLPPHDWVPPGQPNTMPWITHFDPDPSARAGSPFVRGVLGGVIICLILAPLAWFAVRPYVWQSNPVRSNDPVASDSVAPSPVATNPVSPPASSNSVGANSLSAGNSAPPQQAQLAPSEGVQPSATPTLQSAARSPAGPVTQPPESSPAEAKPPANSEASAPGQIARPQSSMAKAALPETPPQDSIPPASQQSAKPADPGESQLMLAREYLEGDGRTRNPTAASQLLWSAVEKGNLTAETTLADLYLRGDGVAKNCDQARVLLSAASGKGNAEAMQKLRQLNQTGCR